MRILPTTWNINIALVDEREKDIMQKESYKIGAMISKLGDDEMSIETSIQMKGKEITKKELNIDELVDVALGINYAQGFDLNVDPHLIDVDDVVPPTILFSDVKRYASCCFIL